MILMYLWNSQLEDYERTLAFQISFAAYVVYQFLFLKQI